MSDEKKPKKEDDASTTIVTGNTVIHNSVGNVHVGSGTQINIAAPKKQ